MSKIIELFGTSTKMDSDLAEIILKQQCPFINKKCIKVKK